MQFEPTLPVTGNLAAGVTGKATKPISPEQMKAIEKASKDFEAVFLNEMLKPMFEGTTSTDPAFGGSSEEGIFKGMMINEFGKAMSNSGGIGIAKYIQKEMIHMQEVGHK